jgi:hypothetical protein
LIIPYKYNGSLRIYFSPNREIKFQKIRNWPAKGNKKCKRLLNKNKLNGSEKVKKETR